MNESYGNDNASQPANPNISNVSEPVTAERAWAPFNDEMQRSTDRWMEIARTQAQQTPSAYMELREVRDREDMDRLNNARRSRDLLEASIANTDYGGQMSPRMVEWLNSQRGIVNDGKGVKNGQIMNGGYNPETGGFGFTVANVDQNGNVTYAPHEMPRTDVYGFMANNPDLFRPEDVDRAKDDILHSGPYTENDLSVFSSRYKSGKDRLDSEYADAQSRWDYRRGRGGLFGSGSSKSDKMEIAKMRQDGFMRKNAMDMLEKDMSFNMLKTPEEKAEYLYKFLSKFDTLTGGKNSLGSHVQGEPPPVPTATSTIEQFRRGRAAQLDKPVRGVGGGSAVGQKTERETPVQTLKPTEGAATGKDEGRVTHSKSPEELKKVAFAKERADRDRRILTGDLKSDDEAEDFVTKHYDPIVKNELSDENVLDWMKEHTQLYKYNVPIDRQDKSVVDNAKRQILTHAIEKYNDENGLDRKRFGEYGLRQMVYDRYGIDIGDSAFGNETLTDDNGKLQSSHWYTGTSKGLDGAKNVKKGLSESRKRRLGRIDDKISNPKDGDTVPLDGGKTAVYNARKRKWEEVA